MNHNKIRGEKKDKLENVVIPNLQKKISTLIKMKKDFPSSDEVRFELQDSMTELGLTTKNLWVLENPPR